jgi:hypothetical protein
MKLILVSLTFAALTTAASLPVEPVPLKQSEASPLKVLGFLFHND